MNWMRQKPRTESEVQEPPTRAAVPEPPQTPAPRREPANPSPSAATIGRSVQIKGEICGSEDLLIDGNIEGKIELQGHHLRIGANGHVKADIRAKHVLVEGEVFGDITAEDKVELSTTGSLRGDIRAPRVALANGSRFKGSIDMEGDRSAKQTDSSPATQAKSGAA